MEETIEIGDEMDRRFGNSSDELSFKKIYSLANRAVVAMEGNIAEQPKFHNETPKLTVESIYNHVYFYADVDSDRCLAMIRTIRELDASLRNEATTRDLPDGFEKTPIWLHIQSGGGDLFSGLAAADQLASIQTPIYSLVEGLAASAATLISLACHKRFIMSSGFMMIHEFTTGVWGTHERFKDEMKLQEMLIELLVEFYSKKTKVEAQEIRNLLKHDSWFSAQQCLEHGLVDEIWK